MKSIEFQDQDVLQGKPLLYWRIAQWSVWLIGLWIFYALIFEEKLGLLVFWNVLIPIAPALFVIATGLWRNICPLATVALMPHRLYSGRKRRLDLAQQGNFALIGVALLFLIVPFRHLCLNFDGVSTAGTIAFLSLLAFYSGWKYEAKSAWCSSMCPVHPVERLYGQKVLYSPQNAQCGKCHNCVLPCPDSTPNMQPKMANKRPSQKIAAQWITGGLPGFIIGWFQVPDYHQAIGWAEVAFALTLPWGGMAISLAVFCAACRYLPQPSEQRLSAIFAAAGVSAYYWYRLPGLVGMGLFPGDGMLIDLSTTLSKGSILAVQVLVCVFFCWWLVFKKSNPSVWNRRPPYLIHSK